MDPSTTILFAVAALLGLNHVVFRIPGWEYRRTIFWTLQLLNLGAATAILAFGVPGFDGVETPIKWVLGLLLILHIITNNQRLVRAVRAGPDRRELMAKRSRIKAALAKHEE